MPSYSRSLPRLAGIIITLLISAEVSAQQTILSSPSPSRPNAEFVIAPAEKARRREQPTKKIPGAGLFSFSPQLHPAARLESAKGEDRKDHLNNAGNLHGPDSLTHNVRYLQSALTTIVLILFVWSALVRCLPEPTRMTKWRRTLLLVTTFAAAFSWPNFFLFHYDASVHLHEFFHYYMGAKYHPEVGYTRLYECTVIADWEDNRVNESANRKVRDLRTFRIRRLNEITAAPEKCWNHFSPERWKNFKEDVRFFRRVSGNPSFWHRIFRDHGFNASPVWMVIGSPLANFLEASRLSFLLISLLDYLLLLAAVFLIYYSFGFESACAATCFFCVNFFAGYDWTGGAFLRYDWFFWSVASICALRLGFKKFAGFSLIYALLLRVFPGCLLAGVLLQAGMKALLQKSTAPLLEQTQLLKGCLIGLVLLVPMSFAVHPTVSTWTGFYENTRKMVSHSAQNHVGLVTFLERRILASERKNEVNTITPKMAPDTDGKTNRPLSASRVHVLLLRISWVVFLSLLLLALPVQPTWCAAILGIGFVSFIPNLTNYYAIIITLYALMWTASAMPTLSLLILGWASWYIASFCQELPLRWAWFAFFIFSHILLVTGYMLWHARRKVAGCSLMRSNQPFPAASRQSTRESDFQRDGAE